MRVEELMDRGITVVTADEDVVVVRDLMRRRRLTVVPVVDAGGALCGVVEERDLCRCANGAAEGPVRRVMIAAATVLAPDTDVREAAQRMLENRLSSVPVVDGGRVVGVLSEADFIRCLGRPH